MDELLNAGWMALAALVLGALARAIDRRIALPGLFAFAAYLGADDLATVVARVLPGTDLIASPWNWEGKIASALLALVAAWAAGLRRSDIGVVLATGLMFGLWHGLGVRDGVPSFDPLPAVMPTVGGLAYAWLRFKTGSLLLPMVAHAGGNALFFAHALL